MPTISQVQKVIDNYIPLPISIVDRHKLNSDGLVPSSHRRDGIKDYLKNVGVNLELGPDWTENGASFYNLDDGYLKIECPFGEDEWECSTLPFSSAK